jgi:hypothetical protein
MFNKYKSEYGLILIELVTTLILIGVIGAFTSLFLHSGITGFLTSKRNSETALKAQIAMNRLSLELRGIDGISNRPVLSSNSITYRSDDPALPGIRTISYNSATDSVILNVNGTSYVLLNQIEPDSFSLTWVERDLNNFIDSPEELSEISVGFKLKDVGIPFNVQVFPRNMVQRQP